MHSSKINTTSIFISEDGTIKISDFKNGEKLTSENKIKEIDDFYSLSEIVNLILSGYEINSEIRKSSRLIPIYFALQLIKVIFNDQYLN